MGLNKWNCTELRGFELIKLVRDPDQSFYFWFQFIIFVTVVHGIKFSWNFSENLQQSVLKKLCIFWFVYFESEFPFIVWNVTRLFDCIKYSCKSTKNWKIRTPCSITRFLQSDDSNSNAEKMFLKKYPALKTPQILNFWWKTLLCPLQL